MRTLLLVDEILSKDADTLNWLKTHDEDDEVVVVPLSTHASLSLQNEGIPILRADTCFSKEESQSMDSKAAEFCRRWHETVSGETPLMTFHGVSIGEALAVDFYFLFIDAIRSAEIAESLMTNPFDRIILPSLNVEGVRDNTYNICYDTLPLLIAHIAATRGIPVIMKGRRRSSRARMDSFALSCTLFVRENGLDLVDLALNPTKPRIAFSYFAQDGIIDNLKSPGGRGLVIPPHGCLQTQKSRQHVRLLLDYLGTEATASKLDKTTSYKGLPLWSILSPLLSAYFSKRLRSVIGLTLWTEFLVKRLRLDCCVTRDDVTPYRNPMCQVLRNSGVPIVIVQDGIRTNDLTGNYVMPTVGTVHAAWGEYYRKWHLNRGKTTESQVITGFPRHDKLVRLPSVNREAICRRFGLDPSRKIALVATEWFQASTSLYTLELEEDYVRCVLKSLKRHNDLQIVIKLHPYFQEKCSRIVSEIARQEGAEIIIAKDMLWELIQVSSFVVVFLSTVAVEALIIGKPVISVNLVDKKDITGLVQDGLAMGVYDEADLDGAIRKCLANLESCVAPDGRRQELLLPFTGPLDGQSSERVAELVESQLLRR